MTVDNVRKMSIVLTTNEESVHKVVYNKCINDTLYNKLIYNILYFLY